MITVCGFGCSDARGNGYLFYRVIDSLSNIGTAHYSIGIALVHSFLLLPSQLYTLMPMLGF